MCFCLPRSSLSPCNYTKLLRETCCWHMAFVRPSPFHSLQHVIQALVVVVLFFNSVCRANTVLCECVCLLLMIYLILRFIFLNSFSPENHNNMANLQNRIKAKKRQKRTFHKKRFICFYMANKHRRGPGWKAQSLQKKELTTSKGVIAV